MPGDTKARWKMVLPFEAHSGQKAVLVVMMVIVAVVVVVTGGGGGGGGRTDKGKRSERGSVYPCTLVERYADVRYPLGHLGPQHVVVRVDEPQRRPVAVEDLPHVLHHLAHVPGTGENK